MQGDSTPGREGPERDRGRVCDKQRLKKQRRKESRRGKGEGARDKEGCDGPETLLSVSREASLCPDTA